MTKSFHNHIFFSENILYLSVFHNQLNLKFGQNNDLEVWEQQIRSFPNLNNGRNWIESQLPKLTGCTMNKKDIKSSCCSFEILTLWRISQYTVNVQIFTEQPTVKKNLGLNQWTSYCKDECFNIYHCVTLLLLPLCPKVFVRWRQSLCSVGHRWD